MSSRTVHLGFIVSSWDRIGIDTCVRHNADVTDDTRFRMDAGRAAAFTVPPEGVGGRIPCFHVGSMSRTPKDRWRRVMWVRLIDEHGDVVIAMYGLPSPAVYADVLASAIVHARRRVIVDLESIDGPLDDACARTLAAATCHAAARGIDLEVAISPQEMRRLEL